MRARNLARVDKYGARLASSLLRHGAPPGSPERRAVISLSRTICGADELPGIGDYEVSIPPVETAWCRRVDMLNLWLYFRFDDQQVTFLYIMSRPPIPLDRSLRDHSGRSADEAARSESPPEASSMTPHRELRSLHGCLERDLLRTGLWRARHGPVLVRFDSREPDEGEPVLGCGGVVEILLEQGTAGEPDDPLGMRVEALSSEKPVALTTVFRSSDPAIPIGTRWSKPDDQLAAPLPRSIGGLDELFASVALASKSALDRESTMSCSLTTARGAIDVLVEPIQPPPHLFVCGSGADVVPVVTMARHLGWRVTVWGASDSLSSQSQLVTVGANVERDLVAILSQIDASYSAMAVVMGHNLSRDREALRALLASRAKYIGVLGPRHRTVSLTSGLPADVLDDPRVHAPVGLDLGAETPEEISLAITSEILAFLRSASHEQLRRRTTIHGGTHTDAPLTAVQNAQRLAR